MSALPDISFSQVNMSVQQVGSDVVVQASGTVNTNLTAISPVGGGVVGGEIDTSGYIYVSGSSTGGVIQPPNFSGPSNIGTAGYNAASAGSGDWFGIWFGISGVLVPSSYVSGQSLSGTGTYSNTSIASLGLTPGSYTWTWGSGANADSLVLTISSAPLSSPHAIRVVADATRVVRDDFAGMALQSQTELLIVGFC